MKWSVVLVFETEARGVSQVQYYPKRQSETSCHHHSKIKVDDDDEEDDDDGQACTYTHLLT